MGHRRQACTHFLAGAGMVVVAMTAVALFAIRGGNAHETRGTHGTALPADLPTGITSFELPVSAVGGAAQAWTGERLLSFGSEPDRSTMVGYEPTSGKWSEYQLPPFAGYVARSAAIWASGRLVVVGIGCSKPAFDRENGTTCFPGNWVSAGLDPTANEWTRYPEPKEPDPGTRGSTAYAIGAIDGKALFQINDRYYLLDPVEGSWEPIALPRRPSDAAPPLVCSTGPSVVAVHLNVADNPNLKDGPVEGNFSVQTFEPDSGSWTTDPSLDVDLLAPYFLNIACGGGGVLVYRSDFTELWNYTGATGSWTVGEAAPVEIVRREPPSGSDPNKLAIPSPVSLPFHSWTGREFVFWVGDSQAGVGPGSQPLTKWPGAGAAYDPQTGTWHAIAAGRDGDIPLDLWTGTCALFISSTIAGDNALTVYNPG